MTVVDISQDGPRRSSDHATSSSISSPPPSLPDDSDSEESPEPPQGAAPDVDLGGALGVASLGDPNIVVIGKTPAEVVASLMASASPPWTQSRMVTEMPVLVMIAAVCDYPAVTSPKVCLSDAEG